MSNATDVDWFNALPAFSNTVDGHPMFYRDVGTGPTLVFVHGWPLSGATWRSVVRRLSTSYRCIVPDLPGAGASPMHWHHAEFFQHLGHCLDRFCEALNLQDYGMLGFDSGGAGARFHAHRSPQVKALLLSNTEVPEHAPTVVLRIQKMAHLPFAAPVFRLLLNSDLYLKSTYGFGSSVAAPSHLDAGFRRANIGPLKDNIGHAIAQLKAADLRHVGDVLQRDVHPHIQCPVTMVWGTADPFFPVDNARMALDAMPKGGGLTPLSDAALLVHEERPDDYAKLANTFFSEHFRSVAQTAPSSDSSHPATAALEHQ